MVPHANSVSQTGMPYFCATEVTLNGVIRNIILLIQNIKLLQRNVISLFIYLLLGSFKLRKKIEDFKIFSYTNQIVHCGRVAIVVVKGYIEQ